MQKISLNNSPFQDKQADFLLAACVSGHGQTSLISALDTEYISTGKVISLDDTIEAPALMTRATHELFSFKAIQILDLGLNVSHNNLLLYQLWAKSVIKTC